MVRDLCREKEELEKGGAQNSEVTAKLLAQGKTDRKKVRGKYDDNVYRIDFKIEILIFYIFTLFSMGVFCCVFLKNLKKK